MTTSYFQLSPQQLTDEVNNAINLHMHKMVKEKIITDDQYAKIQQYVIVVTQKGFFGRVWDKMLSLKAGDTAVYTTVKLIK
jgi:membrane peptidoglycan carboxypeptidase